MTRGKNDAIAIRTPWLSACERERTTRRYEEEAEEGRVSVSMGLPPWMGQLKERCMYVREGVENVGGRRRRSRKRWHTKGGRTRVTKEKVGACEE